MMAQVTPAALVAELRSRQSSIDRLDSDQRKPEDFVSMGMISALKLEQAVALARMVVAIELLAATGHSIFATTQARARSRR
jgi:histidine ammonia-lyase